MQWIAPAEKDANNAALEKRLWDAANQLWAGAGLKQSEYSEPVLGLIFLRFAEVRFSAPRAKLMKTSSTSRRGSRMDELAAPMAEQALALQREIQNLRRTRDLLLSRLLSGQVKLKTEGA